MLVHSPFPPLLVSSASHHPGQPRCCIDQRARRREAMRPGQWSESVAEQEESLGQKFWPPVARMPNHTLIWSVLKKLWPIRIQVSLNQERSFLQGLHINFIFKSVSKTLHSFLLLKASDLGLTSQILHRVVISHLFTLFATTPWVDWELIKPVFPLLSMSQDLSHSHATSCPGVANSHTFRGQAGHRKLQWDMWQN